MTRFLFLAFTSVVFAQTPMRLQVDATDAPRPFSMHNFPFLQVVVPCGWLIQSGFQGSMRPQAQ